jgi:AhpD family alkylhydroperoxidase
MKGDNRTMDSKIKELIAIGASIGANCLPCFEWHYNKCIELGVDRKDIRIAVEIGKKVKERPSVEIAELANSLLMDDKSSCCCSNSNCCGNI